MSAPDAVAIAALVAALPSTVAAVNAWRAKQQATQANAAVNNAPEGEPSIRDMVSEALDIARDVNVKLDRHLSWHQAEIEIGHRANKGEQ